MDWITDLSRAVGEAGAQSLDKWPSVAVLVALGGVVFGAFRTGFVRFGSDVKELLAEKESRIKERDQRIEELKAECEEKEKALSRALTVLKESNATSAKATRVLEGVAVLLAKRNVHPADPGGSGE